MRKLLAVLLASVVLLTGCANPFAKEEVDGVAPKIKNERNVKDKYDLIVVGGEPEGISAAISASRNGLKTLLLCSSEDLGGLYTDGQLNFIDIPETRSGKVLVAGIYKEFFDAVGGSGFDINKAKTVFYDMIKKEKNITLRMRSHMEEPIMDQDKIIGIKAKEEKEINHYYADYIIDATPDADVAFASGAPYTFAGEDIGDKDRHMGVTLVFGLKNLNWDKIVRHLTVDRVKGEATGGDTHMGAKGNLAWGYVREGYGYEPQDKLMRLRGFNMSRQNDGTVLFNSLIIFNVNVLDAKSRAEGIERGKKELEHMLPYLRKTCVGFENAELAGTAKSLYVRESRHIEAEYMLTVDDVLENRNQWDKICVSNYPVDVQPTESQRYGTVVGFGDQYAIAYRSLVPKKVDQLLVVGRSAGYRSLAAGSARIVPTGMACGQAAGVAVAVAKKADLTPRELVQNKPLIKEMQNLLKKQGALLDHQQTQEKVMSSWAYPGVRTLRSLGIFDGGYNNDYRLDQKLSKNAYQNMLNNVLRKSGFSPNPPIQVNENPPARQVVGTIGRVVGERLGITYADDFTVYLDVLLKNNIMTEELLPYFKDGETQPNVAETAMLTANLYHWLIKQPNAKTLIAAV